MDNKNLSESGALANPEKNKFNFIKRHFSNVKIRTKILIMVIVISVFSSVSMSVATFFTIKSLSDHSLETNYNFEHSISEVAEKALLEQAQYFLQSIAHEQSRNVNSVLDEIRLKVLLLSYVVEDVLVNYEYRQGAREIISQHENINHDLQNTYFIPRNVQRTPQIDIEIDRLSHLVAVMPVLTQNPNIVDVFVGMESGLMYAYSSRQIADPYFDPRDRPWYKLAIENPNQVVFTDLYEDVEAYDSEKRTIISAAKTVYDENGVRLGVVSIDIQLENLQYILQNARVTESGYVFIFDNTGRYIIHPWYGRENFNLYPLRTEDGLDVPFVEAYIDMMHNEEGFATDTLNGDEYFLIYSPVSVTGWSIGVVVPEAEILSSLSYFTDGINQLSFESQKNILIMTENAIFVFAIIFVIIVAMVMFVSSMLTRIISQPIQKLTTEVAKIGEGSFEYRIPVESTDEIGILTEKFNNMANNLYEHTQNILMLNNVKSELEVAAYTDVLTGVFNRRHFMELASKLIRELSINGQTCFVVIFDIDHFKSVNDTYGHAVGDEVLKSVAKIANDNIRPYDILARYGGEEFVILIPDIDESSIETFVDRIRVSVCSSQIKVDDLVISVSASFGIAKLSSINDLHDAIKLADESLSINELNSAIKIADEALYKAKRAGRNRTVFNNLD